MWHLYLDESGDLGFDFENKNPSRHLTVCILATSRDETVARIRTAVRRTLRNKVNRGRKNETELKGTSTVIAVKRYFYRKISDCRFGIYAVTLNKIRVFDELRRDAEIKSRLYNYVARLVLDEIPFESADGPVELVVDRSKGKWEMAEFNRYVWQNLQGRLDPRIPLSIQHRDSCTDCGLSAVDLFCWGVFRKYERNDEDWYREFASKVLLDERYL
jgi:hypothetical protein